MNVCSRTVASAVLVTSLVLACGGEASIPDEGPDAPPVITVSVSETAYEAPDTLYAGVLTIRLENATATTHMAHLVKLDDGHSVSELVEAYGEAVRTFGPRPEWMTRYGGPMADPYTTSASVTQDLTPGLYAWVCGMDAPDGTIHFTAGEARPLVVLPADERVSDASAPAADNVLRLVDYAFALEEPLRTGLQTLRVESVGAEPHEVGVAKLAPGATLADIEEWFANPQGPPPASVAGAVTALAPSLTAYLELDLTPGSYVLLCFVSAPDGRPHIAHGMSLLLEVT